VSDVGPDNEPSHGPFGHAIYLQTAEPVWIHCAIKAYNLYSRRRAGKVYPHEIDIQETHTKHYSPVVSKGSQNIVKNRRGGRPAPTTVNSSVRTREYLTTAEIERLMAAARKSSRYGHRDATMILIGYRHGLRASELCDLQWSQVELTTGRLHVRRAKNGSPSVHPMQGDEIRALRRLQREQGLSSHVFMSERDGPMTPKAFHALFGRIGARAKMQFPIHPHMLRHGCGYALANAGHDTRALQARHRLDEVCVSDRRSFRFL
jgi:integrase